MYALVEIKGKQYRVEKGSTVQVDRISGARGETVDFETVLMVHDDSGVRFGTPYLEGVKVSTTISEQARGKKVRVFKYKRRKNYRRTRGHRQYITTVTVDEISGL